MRRLLLLPLLLAGCSAAWQAAREGQEALDRGDVDSAVKHYTSACRQSDDKDWCERADRLYLDLKTALFEEAKPVCGQPGQERRCFDILNRARKVKDDPQLAALADASGATWLTSCRRGQVVTPVDAVLRVRCVEAMHADVATPGYEQQVNAERRAMGDFAAAQAKAAADQGLQANAHGLGTLAQCFSPSSSSAVTGPARAALTSSLIVKTQVATDGLASAAAVCAVLQRASSGRFTCASTGAADLGLRVGLSGSQVSHDFTDTPYSVEYVARREVYDNPEWFRLEHLRQRREQESRTAKKQAALAADDCQTARNDLARAQYCQGCDARRNEEVYCKRASTMDDFAREARRALDDAHWAVQRTDRQLVREIRDTFNYTERTHTWRQNWRVFISSANAALAPRDFTFEVARVSTDRPDFAPAGIEGHVARAPSQQDLDGEAVEKLDDALSAWLRAAMATYARAKESTCAAAASGEAAALECRTSAAFLRGEEPGRFYLQELGKAADAKASYPAAPCMP
jgi:hypothetical protein